MAAEKNKPDTPPGERSLRDSAEEKLARSPKPSPEFKGKTSEQFIYELQVHQIELETQAEELRNAQHALEESRDRYLDLYDFAPTGYLTLTDNALIAEVNLAGATLLGVERSKLINKRFRKFIAPEFFEPWDQYFVNLLRQEEKQTCTLTLKRSDGSTVPARMEGIRITGSGGTNTVRIAISDITDIWQIEALRVSEERFRLLLRNANDGIFIHEITPEGPGKFIEVNDQICRWLGYSRHEMLQMSVADIDVPEQFERIPAIIHQLMTEKHVVFETEHLTKDKKRIPVEISANVFDLNGRSTVLSVIRNITERKIMESEIQSLNRDLEQRVIERTSQLNASLEDKIVLLREVHHRVKNNLQIIISLFNLQSQYIVDENTRQVFRESQNRVRAMSLAHEQLYQSTDIAKIDLENYIRYLGNSLFRFYGMTGKGIVLNTRIQDINVDINTAIPVGLIINELISNSLKHAFPDGKKGEISLTIQRENAMLTILFADTGVGIPADLDWRNAESLGLRLVILLVEQLNGTIELDRSFGTMFTIVVKEKE